MIHITSVKPLFTNIVVTGDKFEKDMYSGGLIIAYKGDLKLWQTVVSVGSSVRDINVGDKVMINVGNYAVKKYDKNSIQNDLDNNKIINYNFKWVTIDKEDGTQEECLLLNDRDILYVFEGEEREDPVVEIPKKKILL